MRCLLTREEPPEMKRSRESLDRFPRPGKMASVTSGPQGDFGPRPLGTIAREWGRIGCLGFGGPPTHIALLRDLCVDRRRWLAPVEFEDAVAACNLLPGPASTQLAIYCAWRLGGA